MVDGRTMLETTLAAYREVFDAIFLVLKAADESSNSCAPPSGPRGNAGTAPQVPARKAGETPGTNAIQPVYAADAALGMAHSLAAGVRAGRQLDFLFIALADMPNVRAKTLHRLKHAVAGTEFIVQPAYHGTPGHPVGFGSLYFRELESLTGDIGAKRVVAAHHDRTVRIDVDDPGVLMDIDTPP